MYSKKGYSELFNYSMLALTSLVLVAIFSIFGEKIKSFNDVQAISSTTKSNLETTFQENMENLSTNTTI